MNVNGHHHHHHAGLASLQLLEQQGETMSLIAGRLCATTPTASSAATTVGSHLKFWKLQQEAIAMYTTTSDRDVVMRMWLNHRLKEYYTKNFNSLHEYSQLPALADTDRRLLLDMIRHCEQQQPNVPIDDDMIMQVFKNGVTNDEMAMEHVREMESTTESMITAIHIMKLGRSYKQELEELSVNHPCLLQRILMLDDIWNTTIETSRNRDLFPKESPAWLLSKVEDSSARTQYNTIRELCQAFTVGYVRDLMIRWQQLADEIHTAMGEYLPPQSSRKRLVLLLRSWQNLVSDIVVRGGGSTDLKNRRFWCAIQHWQGIDCQAVYRVLVDPNKFFGTQLPYWPLPTEDAWNALETGGVITRDSMQFRYHPYAPPSKHGTPR